MALRWYGRSGPEDRDDAADSRDRSATERDYRSVARDVAGHTRDEAAGVRASSAAQEERLIRRLLLAGDRRDLAAQARGADNGRGGGWTGAGIDLTDDVAVEIEDSRWLLAADDRAEIREALARLADLRRLEARDRHLAADDRRKAAADRAAAADDRVAAAADRDQTAIERAQSEKD